MPFEQHLTQRSRDGCFVHISNRYDGYKKVAIIEQTGLAVLTKRIARVIRRYFANKSFVNSSNSVVASAAPSVVDRCMKRR